VRLNGNIAVPPGWGFAPLKRLTRFGYGEAISADDRDPNGTVMVYGSNGPFDQHSAANTLGPCIVVGRKGSYGKCQYSDQLVFAVDTTFVVDQRHTNADLRFLFHLLGILGLDEFSDDTAVPGLSREKAYQSLTPLPPLETQKRIAAFLDEKTARIDALIARKQALLGHLAEKRQALITRAVTKGLNPAAPLKDSGIDWLGQIPAHWGIIPLKWQCSIQSGQVDPTEPPYDKMTLVAPDHIESGTGRLLAKQTAVEQAAISGKYLCHPEDVLYSKIRPALRKVTLIDEVCLCSADMYAIAPGKDFERDYLFYFLLTDAFTSYAELASMRVAMPKVNREALGSFPLPKPPIEEQQDVIHFIGGGLLQLDGVATSVNNSVARLIEYRSALITSAVTGQLEGLQ
jgi:type I restriction enzyme, S subunit